MDTMKFYVLDLLAHRLDFLCRQAQEEHTQLRPSSLRQCRLWFEEHLAPRYPDTLYITHNGTIIARWSTNSGCLKSWQTIEWLGDESEDAKESWHA